MGVKGQSLRLNSLLYFLLPKRFMLYVRTDLILQKFDYSFEAFINSIKIFIISMKYSRILYLYI